MSEWQTIETAPRMQTILMFAVTDIADDGEARNWKMATGFWHSSNRAWRWDGRGVRSYDIQPTHWMPLPAPPAERGAP